MKLSNLILPAIVLVVVGIIYFFYFAPTEELGSFSNFSPGSEINQEINVMIVKERPIDRDSSGKIFGFYAKDRNNIVVKVNLHEPVDENILRAEVIELLGHMHEDSFTASRVSIIK